MTTDRKSRSHGSGTHKGVSTARRNGRPFEVRRSSIQGKGVFAVRRIRPGQRIIEYVGEIVDDDTAADRYDDESMDRHHTFLFSLGKNRTIDAAVNGNEARFINHSCDPNCEAVEDEGRIFIEAIRNIQPGVELTYDYNLDRDPPLPRNWRSLYTCRCGAESCRGTMLAARPQRKRRKKNAKRRGK
jgi:SET domain-containing protein